MQGPVQITGVKTIGERIKWARERVDLTQKQLADKAGVSQGTIGNLESGFRERPRALLNIAAALDLNPSWVETGKGAWSNKPDPNVEEHASRGAVPRISWVQAGSWADVADPYQPGEAEEWLPCPVKHGPRTYCLTVRGQSMFNPEGRPSYAEGDIIFVDPDRDANHGDRVIVRLDDQQEATFKQLLIEDGRKLLKALNPNWPDRYMPINGNATICGVVIGRWVPE